MLCPSGVRPGLLRAVVKTPIRSEAQPRSERLRSHAAGQGLWRPAGATRGEAIASAASRGSG